MGDKTLLKQDIKRAAEEFGLLDPFVEERLGGASYDIASGQTIIIVSEEGLNPIDLQILEEYEIPPGRTAILKSQEKVMMPRKMKGRLSLKAREAAKLLFFAGGPIDPGYRGYLFLPIANLSDAPVKITYGQPIVTAEFTWLEQEAEPYSDEVFESVPRYRLPPIPPAPVHSLSKLTGMVDQHRSQILALQRVQEAQQPTLDATSRIVDFVVLGAVAGVGAGIAAGGIVGLFTQVPEPWNIAAGFGGIGLSAGIALLLRNQIPALFASSQGAE